MLKKKLIPKIEFPQIYNVIAADFSLRRPGFCKLTVVNNEIVLISTSNIDNKTSKKTHGQLLYDIYDKLKNIIEHCNGKTFYIRLKAFNGRGSMRLIGIFKVVGISDLLLNNKLNGSLWYELYPVSVKKLITGNGKSTKELVAKCLLKYVGFRTYKCDDESDATAVAIAWLIQNEQLKSDLESINDESSDD